MKRNIPPKLTDFLQEMLDESIDFNQSTFDFTIKPHCYYIDSATIFVERKGRGDSLEVVWHNARIYGMKGTRTLRETNEVEPCIYCFFVLYNGRMWRCGSLVHIDRVIEAIKADYTYCVWADKEWERKRKRAAKSKIAKSKKPALKAA